MDKFVWLQFVDNDERLNTVPIDQFKGFEVGQEESGFFMNLIFEDGNVSNFATSSDENLLRSIINSTYNAVQTAYYQVGDSASARIVDVGDIRNKVLNRQTAATTPGFAAVSG